MALCRAQRTVPSNSIKLHQIEHTHISSATHLRYSYSPGKQKNMLISSQWNLIIMMILLKVNSSLSPSQSKRIAGRIIPAIATTTAAVAGLMCLELYKVVLGHQNIEVYRLASINLAIQRIIMYQPSKPPKFQVRNSSVHPQAILSHACWRLFTSRTWVRHLIQPDRPLLYLHL